MYGVVYMTGPKFDWARTTSTTSTPIPARIMASALQAASRRNECVKLKNRARARNVAAIVVHSHENSETVAKKLGLDARVSQENRGFSAVWPHRDSCGVSVLWVQPTGRKPRAFMLQQGNSTQPPCYSLRIAPCQGLPSTAGSLRSG